MLLLLLLLLMIMMIMMHEEIVFSVTYGDYILSILLQIYFSFLHASYMRVLESTVTTMCALVTHRVIKLRATRKGMGRQGAIDVSLYRNVEMYCANAYGILYKP